MQSWIGASVDEMWRREPYLLLSVLFLVLRVVLHMLPKVLNHFRTMWASYQPHLNLEIFGETRQILGRILHLFDVERVWTKLKLCKSRNFHKGARNAKVWASSLASVSLGKTSTSGKSSWGGGGRMMHFQKTNTCEISQLKTCMCVLPTIFLLRDSPFLPCMTIFVSFVVLKKPVSQND